MDSRIDEIAAWSRPVDGFPSDFGERRVGREPLDQVGIGDVGSSSATFFCSFFIVKCRSSLLLDDCVSQGPDPVFKPLCLHHHHLAVVGAERDSRHALKGGEQVDRELS